MKRAFPYELKARGFNEITPNTTDNLPRFHYRDMGFKVWNVMRQYVFNIIHNRYLGNQRIQFWDQDIKEDQALHALLYELRHPSLANVNGIPDLENCTDCVNTLIDFLTSIIWTCSAQHSAVNFGQYDYYGFVPNRPFMLRLKMPLDKNQVTWDLIFKALPNAAQTTEIIQVAKVLSMMSPDQIDQLKDDEENPFGTTLDQLKDKHIFGKEYADFMEAMHQLTDEFHKENAKLIQQGDVPYPYLIPDQIASSIAI